MTARVGSDLLLRGTVTVDGATEDLSTASAYQIWVRLPDGETKSSYSTSFTNDGTDGIVEAGVPDTDNDTPGTLKWWAKFTRANGAVIVSDPASVTVKRAGD